MEEECGQVRGVEDGRGRGDRRTWPTRKREDRSNWMRGPAGKDTAARSAAKRQGRSSPCRQAQSKTRPGSGPDPVQSGSDDPEASRRTGARRLTARSPPVMDTDSAVGDTLKKYCFDCGPVSRE